MTWTTEQVLVLAPDAASAKAGSQLAALARWRNPGQSARALWGECQGSGKEPYRTQIDLNGPVFKCSCPSRKFPCKHGLGLLLLFANRPDALAANPEPDWVADWLQSRQQRAGRKSAPEAALAPEVAAVRAGQAAARAERREDRVGAGLDELERWLHDLAREGLAALPGKSTRFFETMAARLVDAQAPGIAGHLRRVAGLPYSGGDWQHGLIRSLSRLPLLIAAWRRLEVLPDGLQADVRSLIGFTQTQETFAGQPGVVDHWLVAAQHVSEEDRLRVQRSWLLGRDGGQAALLLQFAHGQQPFPLQWLPGSLLHAELVYYPSAWPCRAQIGQWHATAAATALPPGQSIAGMLAAYADALGCNLFLDRFPALLADLTPVRRDGVLYLRDESGQALPVAADFTAGWPLLAVSSGRPSTVFGEWDGESVRPLTVDDGRLHFFRS
jgi:hypothetical protein